MKVKNSRLEALKMLISSMELGSQEELLRATGAVDVAAITNTV